MYVFTYKNIKISLAHAREKISLKREHKQELQPTNIANPVLKHLQNICRNWSSSKTAKKAWKNAQESLSHKH